VSTLVTTHTTGDPRIVTESPTFGGLVVMPLVFHMLPFGATPCRFQAVPG
jgi:hypothetical protein